MTTVSEVAPDVFRISTYVPEADLEFGQFLVRDDQPLLFETGMKALFPAVRDAVTRSRAAAVNETGCRSTAIATRSSSVSRLPSR